MTEYIEIKGGSPLKGTVEVSGAKNAALPLLIATLLTSEQCVITNIPNLQDVNLVFKLLEHFGATVEYYNGQAVIKTPRLIANEATYSLVKALRASFWILAPLLARGQVARVSLPGGDIIGARPVDMHLEALVQMGADIHIKHGVVFGTAPQGLKPADIHLRFPSVGATHQILMAAALTSGTSIIRNAAREPEVVELCKMLNQMGADIEGIGSEKLVIHGKSELGGTNVRIIGDRIEAATYALCVAASTGSVRLQGISSDLWGSAVHVFQQSGIEIKEGNGFVDIVVRERLKPVHTSTGPFPEFATDLQALFMAALCTATGESSIEEKVFEGRFGHVSELCRMGSDIRISDHTAIIKGIKKLTGARVEGLDIRAAAALVIAATGAEGTTCIYEPSHIRRGYENLEQKLSKIGVKVFCRVADPEDFMFTGC